MIGDNPRADILGANQANIQSILVQSGVYEPGSLPALPESQVPTFEVANMEEAVKLICDQENLKL